MLKWASVIMLLIAIGAGLALLLQPELTAIHNEIRGDYQSVEHISARDFSNLDQQDVVIFDVREADEHQVSHLPNAIQVDPGIDVDEFLDQYQHLLAEKQVIFYCSVGRRSSGLIARLQPYVESGNFINLQGGLFNWINEQRPVSGQGIHPYNAYWGRLIDDASQIRYQ